MRDSESGDFDLGSDFAEIAGSLKENPKRDFTASRGEYLNGKILARCLGWEFIDAKDVIFFDEDGRFDPEKTNSVLKARLDKTPQAVIPGFYGCAADGSVKTFSRGGSDITGSIVARAAKRGCIRKLDGCFGIHGSGSPYCERSAVH